VQKAYCQSKKVWLAVKTVSILEKPKRAQLYNDLESFIQNGSPFIVKFYGAYLEEGQVKLGLECMDFGSLRKVIDLIKINMVAHNKPAIPEIIIFKLTQQILGGLAYLHYVMGKMHRDIKPDNVLLSSQGYAKLSDFGISRDLDVDKEKLANTFVGTYTYMSPERLEGKPYSFSSDIWSIGMILYEMVTGKYPYPHEDAFMEIQDKICNISPPTIPSDIEISLELRDFISKCLQKDPDYRYSVAELMAHSWVKKFCLSPYEEELLKFLDEIKYLSSVDRKQAHKPIKKTEDIKKIIL
jgi:serine/threonine protein kinase